jgi:hypothetical protein
VLFIQASRKRYVPDPVTAAEMLKQIETHFDRREYREVLQEGARFLDAFGQQAQAARVRFWMGRAAFALIDDVPEQSDEYEKKTLVMLTRALEDGLTDAEAASARNALAQAAKAYAHPHSARRIAECLLELAASRSADARATT